MRAIADEQVSRTVDTRRFERIDFGQQRGRIDHQAVADDRLFPRPQQAAGNQLQNVFPLADIDGMPGIMPALITRNDIEALREEIDDFPLPSSPH